MKKRATWKSCCILLSVAIAAAPVVYAADQETLRMAKAIGEESTTPPTAPKKTTTPATTVKPAETPVEKTAETATESEPISDAMMWTGVGIAVLLAAGGGGGGGGGSSTPAPHP